MNTNSITGMPGSGPEDRQAASVIRQPAARDRRHACRPPHPGPRTPQPATRNRLLLSITLILLISIFCLPAAQALLTDQDRADFKGTIQYLASLGDRSTGTEGNRAAAAYIRQRFEQLGFETVGIQKFAVPIVREEKSTLSLPVRGLSVPVRALRGNAVTPQTIPSPGIQAPLVYVGKGDLQNLNGKAIEGAVILMEIDSSKNWLHVAELGAKALIYVDRGKSASVHFEDKFELSPIQFPRFWLPSDQLQKLFPDFETRPAGLLAEKIRLESKIGWENVISQNIYAIIPGSDPKLQEQSVMVEAFYDSTAWVSGLSPGADEACSVATLLQLASHLRNNPPQRTVLLVASSGHAQTLSGMRELMWSLTTRSKIQRKMKRDLKKLIKKSRNTIKALKNATLEAADPEDPAAQERQTLVKEALEERIKTVSDSISRRLMGLRMRADAADHQDVINELAGERQLLRRLLWKPAYTDLLAEERRMLVRLVPEAIEDQSAILADARMQQNLLDSARSFRGQAKIYDLTAAVSLHLSSHGDGFGAFNYGWQYPFRPRINRTAAH